MQKRKAVSKAKTAVKTKKSVAKKSTKRVTVDKKATVKKMGSKKPSSKIMAKRKSSKKNNGLGILTPSIRNKIVSVLSELERLLDVAEKKMLKKLS